MTTFKRSASSRGSVTSFLLLTLLSIAVPRALDAQSITVSGDPAVLTVDSAVPGSPLDPVPDLSTTYDVSASDTAQVTARLGRTLPDGVTLELELEAPAGAVGQGFVQLTTVDQAVVMSIDPSTYSNLGVTYRLSATTGAGAVPLSSRDVVLTVTHN